MKSRESDRHGNESRFEAYRKLFANLRQHHPQRCELNRAEFVQALTDDATVCAPVDIDGIEVAVPQLVRIGTSEWLNAAYFAARFPNAHSAQRLVHLTMWPGHDLGEAVRKHLIDMARVGTTIVMDGPSSGPWSVRAAAERLTKLLADCKVVSSELLGTQTYWAGPLRNPHITPAPDPSSLESGAHELGLDVPSGGTETGAFLRRDLTSQEVDSMFELYAAAYAVLGDHPCAQGVTPEEFRNMMVDGPKMAKLVFQRRGTVESLCLITPELSKLDWINLEFYQARFGEDLDKGRVHWYPAIATDPTSAGARNARALVELIGELYESISNPAIIVFDTPDLNSAFLPAYLEELINGLPHYEVEFEVIAEHEYWAVELKA